MGKLIKQLQPKTGAYKLCTHLKFPRSIFTDITIYP